MITYLLKSASCLALLLFFYHLVLEKEKMHTFNRYYLLFGVLISLLIPFATLTVTSVAETAVILENETFTPIITEDFTPILLEENPIDYTKYVIGLYLLISSILVFRFGKNLYKIIRKINVNEKIKHANATLVLIDDHILPHTFWKAIFINKKDFKNGKIEKELFTHELTHVTQKHTIDVLLIEALQIVFWINPLFIFLKKAIQLNHEFLADSTVINTHKNTFQYQHLLLNKAAWNNEYYLASNLNYSLTKKRLKMMTTQSSKTIIWLKKLAVMPLLAGFVFLFAERVEAQEKQEIIVEEVFPENGNQLSILLKNDKKIEIKNDLLNISNLKLKLDKEIEDINDAHIILEVETNSKLKKQFIEKVRDELNKSGIYQISFKNFTLSPNSNSIKLKNKNELIIIEEVEKNISKEKVKEVVIKKKKEYIDSPIIKNYPGSKQSIPNGLPSIIYTIKTPPKNTNIGVITDIREKLKDVNSLKIKYLNKDDSKNLEKVTPKEMEIYKTLLAKGKKHNIYKQKDILKMQDIYKRMSKEQKNSVENVSELIPPPPPPKPDWVYTYNRLASKVKRTSDNRKANLIYLKEIYNHKMKDEERAKVVAPEKLQVPPPPPKKKPSSFIKNVNKKTSLVFNSLDEVKKQKETESKLNDDEKRQFLLRKTIIQATTLKEDNFNFKIDGKTSEINDVYNYLHKNPLCIIDTKEEKSGILTVSLDKFQQKKMSSDNLQNVYSKVFKRTK